MLQPTEAEPGDSLAFLTDEDLSNMSIKYGSRDKSPEDDGPIQASMPPPPVAMAASKLRIQALEEQLKQKDKIIHALEAEKRSHLALAAEKARNRELAAINKGWRRHNVNPLTPSSYRSEGIATEDRKGKVKTEKVIFVTEYTFATEKVRKMNAAAELSEARAKELRAEQKDAYRKTLDLIKVAEELEVKIATDTRIRKYTDSDGNVNIGDPSNATAPNNVRLVLNPPKRERSVSVEDIRPTRLRLSQPRAEKVGEDSHRVHSGRVLKASAKARE